MQPSFRGVVWFAWGGVALLLAATAILGLYNAPERAARQPATSISPPARPADTGPAPPVAPLAGRARSQAAELRYRLGRSKRPGGYRRPRSAGRPGPGARRRYAARRGQRRLARRMGAGAGEADRSRRPPARRRGHESRHGPGGGAVRRSPDIVALSVLPRRHRQQGETAALAVLLPGEPGAPARILQRPQDPAAETQSCRSTRPNMAGRTNWSCPATPSRGRGSTSMPAASCSAAPRRTSPENGRCARPIERRPAGSNCGWISSPPTAPSLTASPPRSICRPGWRCATGDTYVVERGNSLWRIARHVYGQGTRYTAIYAANQNTIRDPHRIYPGQELKLPQP